jgi:hypothetical protein
MTETTKDLLARLRGGDHHKNSIKIGGVCHDQRCLQAADALDECLALAAVACEAAAETAESPDLPVFKSGWSTLEDAAAISAMSCAAKAIRAMPPEVAKAALQSLIERRVQDQQAEIERLKSCISDMQKRAASTRGDQAHRELPSYIVKACAAAIRKGTKP